MGIFQFIRKLFGKPTSPAIDEVPDTVVAMHEEARRIQFGQAMPVYTLEKWWVRENGSLSGVCPEHSIYRRYRADTGKEPESYELLTSLVVRYDEATHTCWTVNSVYRLGKPAKPEVCLPALRQLASRLAKIDDKIATKGTQDEQR